MPSPFPGMDPYLEDPAFWTDFHDAFIVYWRDALNDVLPNAYEARVNERTHIIDRTGEELHIPRPDVVVSRDEGTLPTGRVAVAEVEPVTMPLLWPEEIRETYIEIRRRPGRDVVTALELLSPANKTGSDHHVYLAKRNELLHQEVHLVELDLLTAGQRVPLRGKLPVGDYYYFVARADRRPDCDVYAWGVRRPLPKLPVPLKAPDPDVLVDYQSVFTTAYDRGRYRRALNYETPPPGSWSPAAAEWIGVTARSAS